MPHLDLVTFLTQYVWTIFTLLVLFYLLVTSFLSSMQKQLAIRASILPGKGACRGRDSRGYEVFKRLFQVNKKF